MTDNRTTLLPCPFCGGEAEPFNPFPKVEGTWCVLCSECAAATGFEQTEAEAIAAWNTRAERTCKREKHGRKMDGSWRMRCSECGYGIGDKRWAYCPKCGAKVVD